MKIILGSSSQWRKQILLELGYEFDVISPGIDEKGIRHDNPEQLTLAIAEAKNEAVRARVNEPAIIITSDTVVVCNGEVREKPANTEEAYEFLKSYSTYPAETCTAVVVSNTESGLMIKEVDIAKIYFRPIPDEVILKLINQGNIFHSSGGFITEDPLLNPFIDRIDGTIDSIMGMPKNMTRKMIEGARG